MRGRWTLQSGKCGAGEIVSGMEIGYGSKQPDLRLQRVWKKVRTSPSSNGKSTSTARTTRKRRRIPLIHILNTNAGTFWSPRSSSRLVSEREHGDGGLRSLGSFSLGQSVAFQPNRRPPAWPRPKPQSRRLSPSAPSRQVPTRTRAPVPRRSATRSPDPGTGRSWVIPLRTWSSASTRT